MFLNGKAALIMDGQPLGAECARQLVDHGADLPLHHHPAMSDSPILRLREELSESKAGINASAYTGNISTVAAVDQLFPEVLVEHKKINVVVNTAGPVPKKASSEISEKDYDKMLVYSVFVDDQRRRAVDAYQAELTQRQPSRP